MFGQCLQGHFLAQANYLSQTFFLLDLWYLPTFTPKKTTQMQVNRPYIEHMGFVEAAAFFG